MSKFASFFSSTGSQVEVAYPSMTEMIKDAAAGGYKAKTPVGQTFIHRSKNGNLQFIMSNGSDNKFIRISPNLDSALKGGEPIQLQDQPVYQGRKLNDDGEEVGKFLVIGLAGVRLEDAKLEDGITAYLAAEPA